MENSIRLEDLGDKLDSPGTLEEALMSNVTAENSESTASLLLSTEEGIDEENQSVEDTDKDIENVGDVLTEASPVITEEGDTHDTDQ